MEIEKQKKHIYLVKHAHGATERLIEASSRSAAVQYAAKTSIKVELASQRDLIRLVGDGVEVENEDQDGINSGV